MRVATETQAGLQQLIEGIVGTAGVVHSTTTLALTTPLPYRAVPLLKHIAKDAGMGQVDAESLIRSTLVRIDAFRLVCLVTNTQKLDGKVVSQLGVGGGQGREAAIRFVGLGGLRRRL